MESAKLSSKSQITVPTEVRRHLRLGVGDRISFEPAPDGRFIIGKSVAPKKSDGAARRRLAGKVPKSPSLADGLIRTVWDDDQRIRSGR